MTILERNVLCCHLLRKKLASSWWILVFFLFSRMHNDTDSMSRVDKVYQPHLGLGRSTTSWWIENALIELNFHNHLRNTYRNKFTKLQKTFQSRNIVFIRSPSGWKKGEHGGKHLRGFWTENFNPWYTKTKAMCCLVKKGWARVFQSNLWWWPMTPQTTKENP